MKPLRVLLAMITIVIAVIFQGCTCEPEIIGNVPNTLRPQETNNWCWAATTQMLAEHDGIIVKQCDLANHRFGKTNCCDEKTPGTPCPKTDDCNTPGWPELDYVGLKFSETSTPLSWEDVQKQIYCSKNLMGYAYGTSGVVGHVLVIKGYVTVAGTDYVVLNDPWPPCSGTERLITYDEYSDPAGSSTHWNTWYNIEKK